MSTLQSSAAAPSRPLIDLTRFGAAFAALIDVLAEADRAATAARKHPFGRG